MEVQKTLDAHPISAHPFPFTACCQGGFSYSIRIPYSPDDSSAPKGYFYMMISDPTPVMYDEVYYGGDHQMHVKRHDTPLMKVGPYNARGVDMPRFLPGAAQAMPDFTDYKPKQVDNFWTSADAPKKGIEYHPLVVEEKLWDRHAQNNFSPEAKALLLSDIRQRLRALLKGHKVGQQSDCWGHAGCDWTYSEKQVAGEQKLRSDALNACKPVMDEFHLDSASPTSVKRWRQ